MRLDRYIFLGLLFLAYLLIGCDTVEKNATNPTIGGGSSNEWLVPTSEVFDGGPGKDGIPALTLPTFQDLNQATYLSDNDLVLIYSQGEEVRIYPHPILDWHEIINDKVGETSFSVTYCPLTGSGICWDRIIDGIETTFGVSGLLYNTNLIPYDRITQSNWSQMRLESINGTLISTKIKTLPIVETSWETAKSTFPNSRVVSTNTGHSRSYGNYPYGNYRTNHSSLLFPVNHKDSRLKSKERVLGVFYYSVPKAYRITDFEGGKLIRDNIGNDTLLIFGNIEENIIVAFEITGTNDLEFSHSELNLPYIIKDKNGNHYDIFGKSMEAGTANLKPVKSFVAYWFAWAAFYPNTELYQM
jgi:hypothetical protein